MLKIIAAPNPILSRPTKPIAKIDSRILNLIEQMKKTLLVAKDPEGVGLAAPQVGKSIALFIAKPTPKSKIQTFINPKVILKTKTIHLTINSGRLNKLNKTMKEKSLTKLEGCLSLLNIWGEVKRDSEITLSYLDEKGNPHVKSFKGLMATIVQHERDHLNGILFPKKVLEQQGKLYKSKRNKKGEDEFEKIEL